MRGRNGRYDGRKEVALIPKVYDPFGAGLAGRLGRAAWNEDGGFYSGSGDQTGISTYMHGFDFTGAAQYLGIYLHVIREKMASILFCFFLFAYFP